MVEFYVPKRRRGRPKSKESDVLTLDKAPNLTRQLWSWLTQHAFGIFMMFAKMGGGKTAWMVLMAELYHSLGRDVYWLYLPPEARDVFDRAGLGYVKDATMEDLIEDSTHKLMKRKRIRNACIIGDESLILFSPYGWSSKYMVALGQHSVLQRQRNNIWFIASQRIIIVKHLRELSMVTVYKHFPLERIRDKPSLTRYREIIPAIKNKNMGFVVAGEDKFEGEGIINIPLPACWAEHGERISKAFKDLDVSGITKSEWEEVYELYMLCPDIDWDAPDADWEVTRITGCKKTIAKNVLDFAFKTRRRQWYDALMTPCLNAVEEDLRIIKLVFLAMSWKKIAELMRMSTGKQACERYRAGLKNILSIFEVLWNKYGHTIETESIEPIALVP